jgi:signal transduction histidine kinase
VLDRGPGVPDALKASLFERFRRGGHAKGDPDGAGIGLAIVRAVAAAHGGAAWVEDRPGGGAAFVFALPAPGAAGRAGPGPRRAG